jgi:hypothetical protein
MRAIDFLHEKTQEYDFRLNQARQKFIFFSGEAIQSLFWPKLNKIYKRPIRI